MVYLLSSQGKHLINIQWDLLLPGAHSFSYQVVNAQQQCLNAAGRVGVSGSAGRQEAPQELWQELQCETLQLWHATPVKLKQLVTNWLQQLKKDKKKKKTWLKVVEMVKILNGNACFCDLGLELELVCFQIKSCYSKQIKFVKRCVYIHHCSFLVWPCRVLVSESLSLWVRRHRWRWHCLGGSEITQTQRSLQHCFNSLVFSFIV